MKDIDLVAAKAEYDKIKGDWSTKGPDIERAIKLHHIMHSYTPGLALSQPLLLQVDALWPSVPDKIATKDVDLVKWAARLAE